MNYRKSRPSSLTNAVAGFVPNACWFAAAWGAVVFLTGVLAQAWNEEQSATRTACVAAAWLLGCLLGVRLGHTSRRSSIAATPLWAGAYLACALAWQLEISPWLEHPHGAVLWSDALLLGAVALLMGTASSCWLERRKGWPAVGEHVSLARELVCLPLGLFVTWVLPQWAGLLGFLLLAPLFVLDLARLGRLAFSGRIGMDEARSWASAEEPADWPPLRLEGGGSSRWWWVSYLARRRYIPPTVLAVGLGTLTVGIWFSIPTPFVATLIEDHQVRTLYWLIAGTLAAPAVGWLMLSKSRGVIGAPDRLIPPGWQKRAWQIARFSLFAMAASLILLGLPYFQAPWWLALWFALYTLAEGIWAVLLSRLMADIGTQAYSLRHLYLDTGGEMSGARLPYERALEERAQLALATWEGVLAAVAAPLCGLLIDHTTVDDTFVVVGGVLFLFVALAPLATRLLQGDSEPSHQVERLATR
jgi:hypothetical protein